MISSLLSQQIGYFPSACCKSTGILPVVTHLFPCGRFRMTPSTQLGREPRLDRGRDSIIDYARDGDSFGPCWAFSSKLLGPLIGLGPVGPIHLFGPCWAHSFIRALLGPFIYWSPVGSIHLFGPFWKHFFSRALVGSSI